MEGKWHFYLYNNDYCFKYLEKKSLGIYLTTVFKRRHLKSKISRDHSTSCNDWNQSFIFTGMVLMENVFI